MTYLGNPIYKCLNFIYKKQPYFIYCFHSKRAKSNSDYSDAIN